MVTTIIMIIIPKYGVKQHEKTAQPCKSCRIQYPALSQRRVTRSRRLPLEQEAIGGADKKLSQFDRMHYTQTLRCSAVLVKHG